MTLGLALTACHSSSGRTDPAPPDLPAGTGPLATDAVVWAVGDTVHVGERTIRAGGAVRAMVAANGRIYFVRGRSDVVRVTDGDRVRATDLRADELRASEDGRYLGFLDTSEMPWSTVVVDLESGEVVVRDDAGMGDADDDLADLYEDAEPRVLGFDGDELFVRTASGIDVMSWDPRTGERTDHGDQFFFAGRDPGGGRSLPALVRHGRLVVPRDPYLSTQWGHVSPDGSVTLQLVANRTEVFAVDSGRRLPTDLHGRKFVLGGWTDDATAYGVAFDGTPFGPHRVTLVTCRLTVEQQRCRALRTIRPPAHQLVLFPSGSAASDY
ncbi:hypothetical protein PD653_4715 [Nocardioides sp. PD653]|nr:hypothetical protein PD653B2_4256 [Nocardioides sp. PD653-B2]GAW57272.1 hypothetical protein PD653_4715 [Nocardioides sp. PD653]